MTAAGLGDVPAAGFPSIRSHRHPSRVHRWPLK